MMDFTADDEVVLDAIRQLQPHTEDYDACGAVARRCHEDAILLRLPVAGRLRPLTVLFIVAPTLCQT